MDPKTSLARFAEGREAWNGWSAEMRSRRVRLERSGLWQLRTDSRGARNLFLGREPIKGPRLLNRMDQAAMDEVARQLLKQVGITKDIPPTTPISSLSGGERQAVAIARAMHFDSDLIILDEPTNNLGVAETQGVLRFVRSARDSGHSCIFIAHNIHHVFQVVSRIVVMRRGRIVADDIDPRTTSIEEVERIITGMSDSELRPPAPAAGEDRAH